MPQREQLDAPGARKQTRRPADRLAFGAIRTARCPGGTPLGRRLLPEHRLHTQKMELWSARVGHLARNGQPLGLITRGVTIDMSAVLRHKREMVRQEIELHLQNFSATGTGVDCRAR